MKILKMIFELGFVLLLFIQSTQVTFALRFHFDEGVYIFNVLYPQCTAKNELLKMYDGKRIWKENCK